MRTVVAAAAAAATAAAASAVVARCCAVQRRRRETKGCELFTVVQYTGLEDDPLGTTVETIRSRTQDRLLKAAHDVGKEGNTEADVLTACNVVDYDWLRVQMDRNQWDSVFQRQEEEAEEGVHIRYANNTAGRQHNPQNLNGGGPRRLSAFCKGRDYGTATFWKRGWKLIDSKPVDYSDFSRQETVSTLLRWGGGGKALPPLHAAPASPSASLPPAGSARHLLIINAKMRTGGHEVVRYRPVGGTAQLGVLADVVEASENHMRIRLKQSRRTLRVKKEEVEEAGLASQVDALDAFGCSEILRYCRKLRGEAAAAFPVVLAVSLGSPPDTPPYAALLKLFSALGLRMASAYSPSEPPTTLEQGSLVYTTHDYIFYNSNCFEVAAVLPTVPKGGDLPPSLPTYQEPSDHLPIGVTLRFLK